MQGFLYPLVLTVHLLVGLTVIGLVLLQHGKGADMGAAFGSGASGSLFGASGSANFMSRATGILAAVFFMTSLGLSYMATNMTQPTGGSVLDAAKTQSAPASTGVPSEPAAPTAAPDGSKSQEVPK